MRRVSFIEAVESGRRILWFNPDEGEYAEGEYVDLDKYLNYIGNGYSDEVVRDILLNDEFIIE